MELFQLYSLVCDHRYAKNVVYRPLARSDAFFLFQATQEHPEFNEYLGWHKPETLQEVLIQIDKMMRQTVLNQAYAFSLSDRQTGKWAGISVLRPYRDGVEISLYIHPAYWSKGAALAAGSGLIECVFNTFNIPLYGRAMAGNKRILRIYDHYGFERIPGDETAPHTTKGMVTLQVYTLSKERWKPYSGLKTF